MYEKGSFSYMYESGNEGVGSGSGRIVFIPAIEVLIQFRYCWRIQFCVKNAIFSGILTPTPDEPTTPNHHSYSATNASSSAGGFPSSEPIHETVRYPRYDLQR